MITIQLSPRVQAHGFTALTNGSYVGYEDTALNRWRYFEIIGKGNALEPTFRAKKINEERSISLGLFERELLPEQLPDLFPITPD